MKCPECKTENLKTAYSCIHCGRVLHSIKLTNALTWCLIGLAITQLCAILILYSLLANGSIAASYLKNNQLSSAAKIVSKHQSAELSSRFQEQLKICVQNELDSYHSGKHTEAESLQNLKAYPFNSDESKEILNSAIESINNETEYHEMIKEAETDAYNGKYDKSMTFYQQIKKQFPQYNEKTDRWFEQLSNEIIADAESNIDELSTDILRDTPYSESINTKYKNLFSSMNMVQEIAKDEQVRSKARDIAEQACILWLSYKEDYKYYFGENGALELADTLDQLQGSDNNLIEADTQCVKYYDELMTRDPKAVYKDLIQNWDEINSYANRLETDEYQALIESAKQQWQQSIITEFSELANQYRKDRGIPALEHNTALDDVASVLLDSMDQWDETEYVSGIISDHISEWAHAWRVYHESYDCAESAVADSECIFNIEPSQIGIGVKIHDNEALCDIIVILLEE